MKPNDKKNTALTTVEILTLIPTWLALFIGLTYGTGFLCVFTYLNHFGIRETGTDFFKLKYVHVGGLFLLFPLSVALPLVMTNVLRINLRNVQRDTEKYRIYFPTVLLIEGMLLTFYVFICFFPQGSVFNHELIMLTSFSFGIVGPFFVDRFMPFSMASWWSVRRIVAHYRAGLRTRKATFSSILLSTLLRSPSKFRHFALTRFNTLRGWFNKAPLNRPTVRKYIQNNFGIAGRLMLVLLIFGTFYYYAFTDVRGILKEMLFGEVGTSFAGIYYILFLTVLFILIWRTYGASKRIDSAKVRLRLWVVTSFSACAIYFMSILSFALHIYPYIPVAKGGGDYVDGSCVQLSFKEGVTNALSPEINGVLASSANIMILIERTPSVLYLAASNDGGGPTQWRKGIMVPKIIEIHDDALLGVLYLNRDIAVKKRPIKEGL